MRTKLMLEALAAWLALAAASGQACASIQTGANSVFGANSVSTMVANPEAALDEITTPYSDGKAPANGSIHANVDFALLTSAAAARKGTRTRLTTGVHAPARSPFRVDAPQSNATLGFSPSGAVDFTPSRKSGYGTELKRRAVFSQHDVVGASQGVLVAANGGSGQIKAIRTVREGDLDAEKFYLIANAKLAPGPTVPVPEPGNWATVLAGLLGVIAIARRRMSL
jgi:hypothetical protein